MSWITVKVVKTRGVEEFWFCAELELAAESRGPHAAREAMVTAELAPSKVSADLRDRRWLHVRRGFGFARARGLVSERGAVCGCGFVKGCGFAAAEICVQRCFIATSFKDMRAGSYGAENKKLIA